MHRILHRRCHQDSSDLEQARHEPESGHLENRQPSLGADQYPRPYQQPLPLLFGCTGLPSTAELLVEEISCET